MAIESINRAVLLLPLVLMACDVWSAVTIPVAKHRHQAEVEPPVVQNQAAPRFSASKDASSVGGNFHISYCTSCSYKNMAMQVKNLLERDFPGTRVSLSNYPPPTYKLMLSKVVPLVQFGGIGIVVAGDHVFPRLGYAQPPVWYDTLRQNRFGTVASAWLLGNALQSFLVSTGAFEVYYDGDLLFSKLETKRFPDDVELRGLIVKVLEKKKSALL